MYTNKDRPACLSCPRLGKKQAWAGNTGDDVIFGIVDGVEMSCGRDPSPREGY